MEKLDLKKAYSALFSVPAGKFVEIHVPSLPYLMVDGHGDPNASADYRDVVESLYATAYAIKFGEKANGRDFVVAPLEGLWTAADPTSFVERRKHEWHWTMMIMVPDFVTGSAFEAARAKAERKRGRLSISLRLERLHEGRCLQALHVGSYDDEGPLLAELHDRIMPETGVTFGGPHHEIYLSDPRKTAPAKLKTILRQPIRPA